MDIWCYIFLLWFKKYVFFIINYILCKFVMFMKKNVLELNIILSGIVCRDIMYESKFYLIFYFFNCFLV